MWMFLIALVVCLIILWLYSENTSLQVSKKIITTSKLPKGFNGYKIAHISDFHNTTSKRLAMSIVGRINKSKVDMVVITGDTLDSRRTNVKVALKFISMLVNNNNVYYVPGNHESRIKEYEEFKKQIINLGVNVLDNKTVVLTKADEQINLIGINDPAFSYNRILDDRLIAKNEIESLEYDKDLYTMLLSHRPELFSTYVEQKIDVVFVGHAHGGQIRIPFLGGVIAPAQGFFPKYTEGIHKEMNTIMVISRGIGNSLFPFRINNRPELSVVELYINK